MALVSGGEKLIRNFFFFEIGVRVFNDPSLDRFINSRIDHFIYLCIRSIYPNDCLSIILDQVIVRFVERWIEWTLIVYYFLLVRALHFSVLLVRIQFW